jgi:hypothetical protein
MPPCSRMVHLCNATRALDYVFAPPAWPWPVPRDEVQFSARASFRGALLHISTSVVCARRA